MLRSVAAMLVVCVTLALAGCGGGAGNSPGGGPQAPGVPVTVVLGGDSALDGAVASDGQAFSFGGGPNTGDADGFSPGVRSRQFFAFTLAGLPAGAQVTTATIQLHQRLVTGTPFASQGVVLLEHVDFGGSLDGGDYGLAPLEPMSLLLSDTPATGQHTLDVTGFVQADVDAGRIRSEFRLRFSLDTTTDGDGANDSVHFVDSENSGTGDGFVPRLTVTFVP